MRTSVIAHEVVDVLLSPAEVSAALWARDASRCTFEQSVEMGYLDAVPELPRVVNNHLLISTDSVVWEEFDYQLTIGLAELEFPEDQGVHPEDGVKLAKLLHAVRKKQSRKAVAVAV